MNVAVSVQLVFGARDPVHPEIEKSLGLGPAKAWGAVKFNVKLVCCPASSRNKCRGRQFAEMPCLQAAATPKLPQTYGMNLRDATLELTFVIVKVLLKLLPIVTSAKGNSAAEIFTSVPVPLANSHQASSPSCQLTCLAAHAARPRREG